MNREELIDHLSSLQNFTPVPPDLFEQLKPMREKGKTQQGKAQKSKTKKRPSLPNPLQSTLLHYASPKDSGHEAFLGYTAFSIAANISIHCMQEPSRLQLSEMLEITGSTADFMARFVNNGGGLEPDMVPAPRLRPAVFILAAALEAAMADKSEWSNREEENQSLIRLQKLTDYMQERGLLLCMGQKTDEDYYEEFVINHAENVLKRECIANSLSLAFRLIKSSTAEIERARDAEVVRVMKDRERFAIKAPLANPQPMVPLANERITDKEAADMLNLLNGGTEISEKPIDTILERIRISLPPDTRAVLARSDKKFQGIMKVYDNILEIADDCRECVEAEEKDMMRDAYLPTVAEDALRAIVSGEDEIFKLKIGRYIWQEFMTQCDIPVPVVIYDDLEDEEEWDSRFTDCNGRLGLRIYDEDDLMTVRTDSQKGMEDITLPLSSVLAKYSGRTVGSHLYIRKSYIKLFKEAGYSDRRARDFAIVLGVQAELDRFETVDYKLKREKLFEGLESAETVERESDDTSEEGKKSEELERRLAQAWKDNQVCRHEISTLQRKNDAMGREIERLKKTLADKEETEDDVEEQEPEQMEFPYRTKLKIVVYGGFEVFHKSLLNLLPDVRIVESAAHIDVIPVRNADIVFLQTNKTGHSGFWTVCDACKSNGVPYVYLNYASAKRCAEVMVNEIKKIEK